MGLKLDVMWVSHDALVVAKTFKMQGLSNLEDFIVIAHALVFSALQI
jgi:hypothetical protein